MNEQLFAIVMAHVELTKQLVQVELARLKTQRHNRCIDIIDENRTMLYNLEQEIIAELNKAEIQVNGAPMSCDSSVDCLKLPSHVNAALSKACIFYIGQLTRVTFKELGSIEGIGRQGVVAINNALADNNFKLDAESDWVIPGGVSELGTWVFNDKNCNKSSGDLIFLSDIALELESKGSKFKVTIGPSHMGDSNLQGVYIRLNNTLNVNYSDVKAFRIEWANALDGIYKNNNDQVRKLLDRKLKPDPANPNELLDKPIEDLSLTVRTINCLRSEDIFFIGQVVRNTERSLLMCPNLGRKSFNEIVEVLASHNLKLDPNFQWGIVVE